MKSNNWETDAEVFNRNKTEPRVEAKGCKRENETVLQGSVEQKEGKILKRDNDDEAQMERRQLQFGDESSGKNSIVDETRNRTVSIQVTQASDCCSNNNECDAINDNFEIDKPRRECSCESLEIFTTKTTKPFNLLHNRKEQEQQANLTGKGRANIRQPVTQLVDDDDGGDKDQTKHAIETKTNKLSEQQQIYQDENQVIGQTEVMQENSEFNLSFCGCGFLGIYHVGVASCFHEYAPQLSGYKVSGVSVGSIVAVAYVCGNLQLAYCTTDILAVAIAARSHTLGSFHPRFDIQGMIRDALERGLPEDAHERANGKLHISLTRVDDGENVIINQFESTEELIQVVLCSCFIPFWSGLKLPKFKGVAYIDGGFSNNLLKLNDKTITVSPFAGEADICPQDDNHNLLQLYLSNTSFALSADNLYRLSHALLPPEPEVLSDLCKRGFADGIRFLQQQNLISCTKCLEIRSSLLVTTTGEDMEDVITMNHQSVGPHNHQSVSSQSNYDTVSQCGGVESGLHQIVLEQQEQELIEITGRKRRASVVSTTSQVYSAQQQATIKPSASIQNLLLCTDNGVGIGGDMLDEMHREYLDITTCKDCAWIKDKALNGPLPQRIRDRIRDACDTVNKSLSNWIYSHRPIKYLTYLMVPYYLPVDISITLIQKYWRRLPTARSELVECIYQAVKFLIDIIRRVYVSKPMSTMLLDSPSSKASWLKTDANMSEKKVIKNDFEATTTTPHSQAAIVTSHAASSEMRHHRNHHNHNHQYNNPIRSTSNTQPSTVPQRRSSLGANQDRHLYHQSIGLNKRSGSNQLLTGPNIASGSGLTMQSQTQTHTRELHSLEDTFDNIVDVTTNQEARIFAYYFRDAKNRLQVTEIFDFQRANEMSTSSNSSGQTSVGSLGRSVAP